jgi:hypothetical protein
MATVTHQTPLVQHGTNVLSPVEMMRLGANANVSARMTVLVVTAFNAKHQIQLITRLACVRILMDALFQSNVMKHASLADNVNVGQKEIVHAGTVSNALTVNESMMMATAIGQVIVILIWMLNVNNHV